MNKVLGCTLSVCGGLFVGKFAYTEYPPLLLLFCGMGLLIGGMGILVCEDK